MPGFPNTAVNITGRIEEMLLRTEFINKHAEEMPGFQAKNCYPIRVAGSRFIVDGQDYQCQPMTF